MQKMQRTKKVIIILMIVSMVFLLLGGCGKDDDDYAYIPAVDPCAGPVPCLTEDWGNTYYQFIDQYDNPILVMSDGAYSDGVGIIYPDGVTPYPCLLGGPVVDCHNGTLSYGGIDWDWSGTIDPDEWLTSVQGNVNICVKTLKVTNLVLDGVPFENVTATYVTSGTLTVQSTFLQEFIIQVEEQETQEK